MRYYLYTLMLFATFLVPNVVAAPLPIETKVVFVEAADVPNKIPRELVLAIFWQIAQQLNVPDERIPYVIVFHVSRETGSVLGMHDVAVHRNSGRVSLPEYYEVWLIGNATLPNYIIGMQAVLERHLNVKLSEADRNRVLRRVIMMMQNTISAQRQ